MHADPFRKATKQLTIYQNTSDLDPQELVVLGEVKARLSSGSRQYREARRQNDKLLKSDALLSALRQVMTDENVNRVLTQQAKVNPNLDEWLKSTGGKAARVQSTEIRTHNLGELGETSKRESDKIIKLHHKTEMVYHNLWAIKGRLNQLPLFEKFNPVGVRDVRNHLIEHTDKSSSGAYIFSFGIATNGPVLRPMRPSGILAPNDPGLEKNVSDFLDKIVSIVRNNLTTS